MRPASRKDEGKMEIKANATKSIFLKLKTL
jgi:hypothetical protein